MVFDVITRKPLPPRALEKISKKGDLESVEQLFGGLLTLVQTILRVKSDSVKENDLRLCLKTLKFTEDCSNEFINSFLENRGQLYAKKSFGYDSPYFFRVKKLDWRIDITVSSSSLSKSFDTVIIVQLLFTNGESRSFELSISKFHLLRLYVASLLKEFQVFEKKSGARA